MFRVVIVEDEELVRRGIVTVVNWASVGCEVVGEAASGAEGVEVIRSSHPDIVVTDIRMPGMDGLEMMRRLREEGCRARFILLTAYSDFSYAQTAVKLGAADYLLKPFHDGELEAAVARILEKGRARADTGLEAATRSKNRYVAEAAQFMASHLNDPDMSVGAVARQLGLSEGHLSHLFKKETGCTVSSSLTACRMEKAKELLSDCRSRVYEVAERVGYRDIAHFSSSFKKAVGVSPSEYQNRQG